MIGDLEFKFAQLIWNNEPIKSGELITLCAKRFGWKKSTTYTVLKRLCDKGLFENNNGIVKSLISENDYFGLESERAVNNLFNGSLPMFISSFTQRQRLSEKDIEEIKRILDL